MNKKRPRIGLRIIKSAIAVFICMIIYIIRGQRGIPFYSAIAAILCMQPYIGNARKVALNRITGTLIGAFYGIIILYLVRDFMPSDNEILRYFVVSFTIILVIYTTVLINKTQTSYFTCVVFLSITVIHMDDMSPALFVADRVIDTFIGIGVSLAINEIRLPRRKNNDILFVSGIDDTLVFNNDTMTNFSKVELNKMIEKGALFTVSTERTPGSIMESMSEINLKLPVVTMNGAALYDPVDRTFIKTFSISAELTSKVIKVIEDNGYGYFANTVFHDILLIYFDGFKNTYQENLYNRLRKSFYRNYIMGRLPENSETLYIFVLDKAEAIERLREIMLRQEFSDDIKVVTGPYKDYKDCSYLKVYDKAVSRKQMIQYLNEYIGVEKTYTFGSIEGMYDSVISDDDQNEVVRTMKKIYEPVDFSFLFHRRNR